MSNILVTVDEQNLHITDAPKIAAQGVNENYVIFTFDVSWSGFGKVALFYREEDEETVYESVIDGTGKALVPHEVTDQDGKICFGIAGIKGDVIYTSEILKYKIVKGLYTAGQETEPPTPGIYEQMLAVVSSMADLLDNTPYLYYDGDDGVELPIHTINDSVTSASSTWSSEKIAEEIGGGTSIQALTERVTDLETDVSGIDQDITGLTSDVTTLNTRVNGLIPEFIPAADAGAATSATKKGDVSGGCYKFGNLVIVDIKITMTTTYDNQNHYTGYFAELGEGLVPAQDKAALSAFVNLSNGTRYPLTCFATTGDTYEVPGINIGSPSLKLTAGMEIYINGAYAASTVTEGE